MLYLAWQLGAPPWIALVLACSFGLYGLVRKLAPFDSVHGLAVESGVMLLPAVAYLLWCEGAAPAPSCTATGATTCCWWPVAR